MSFDSSFREGLRGGGVGDGFRRGAAGVCDGGGIAVRVCARGRGVVVRIPGDILRLSEGEGAGPAGRVRLVLRGGDVREEHVVVAAGGGVDLAEGPGLLDRLEGTDHSGGAAGLARVRLHHGEGDLVGLVLCAVDEARLPGGVVGGRHLQGEGVFDRGHAREPVAVVIGLDADVGGGFHFGSFWRENMGRLHLKM
mgnify:CR=1 FL=1